MFLPKRETTVDGLEKTFATNYLSHFLLTQLLFDALKAAAPATDRQVQQRLWELSMSLARVAA